MKKEYLQDLETRVLKKASEAVKRLHSAPKSLLSEKHLKAKTNDAQRDK
jgi:DNA primase